ncbi:unnamed protein product [Chilo suppressalis]|uniref:Thioredoxin domain-containing protein n=1 Tax=Chilo suppressalis TaxID=168631 RepID=A0ABN8E9P8_CHISP|nr:hypothetical protein evm_004065 [Chilo suppressalis]CAH0667337.1 unnamed protein product [Chilo suppressalis]
MFPTAYTEDIAQVTSLKKKPGVTSDVHNSVENTQIVKHQNNRELTLNMLVKEMVFCIALALTTYGALHNSPTKISNHPQAVRFFDYDSVVTDWYRGQLSKALTVINSVDISFVMYYAPWDAESQYVRGEFEKAASVLSKRVHFSAINCWNPGSECRLQHNKIPSWPILMAYTVTSRGVLYKGPRDAHSMVKFLRLIMYPLKRVSSTEDLVNMLSMCEAVAVAYTPLKDTSKYYNIWYYVALKSREYDTIGEICFATVTSEDLAAELGVETLPNARLMLWNDTKEYITEDHMQLWNESSLLQWVLENFTQPVARIIPMWKKAFSFEKYADGNPILMLFTPLNPLYQQLPTYDLLREVAMEYYNCNNNETSQWISELIKLQQVQRLLYQQKDFKKYCQEYKFRKPARKSHKDYKKEVISQNNKYPWNNITQKNQKSETFTSLLRKGLDISKSIKNIDDESEMISTLALLHQCDTTGMPVEKEFNEIYEKCEKYEENLNNEEEMKNRDSSFQTSMLPFEDDPLSPENLVQDSVKDFCKVFKFANEIGNPVAPAKVHGSRSVTRVEGLACKKNFTLHILAIDSVRNHHFAEFLGVDIRKMKDMTAAIILDTKLETQYVLSEEYSAKSVRDFIYNYTYKNIKRSLRTHVEDASHTHYYGSDGDSPGVAENHRNESVITVVDLTTRTFRKIVRTPGTVSLVAVCGGACTASTTRALLEAARLLSACELAVTPARLDAIRHDLPWHYTVHHYPTVFVFPPDRVREADSRAYPPGARVTSSGLVALALRALGPLQHLRVRLALCANTKISVDKKVCLRDIREHVTTFIARNLKYWRRTSHTELKDAFLKRLQNLHDVSLKLSLLHTSDLNGNSDIQRSLLDSLSILTKSWDFDLSLLRKNVKLINNATTS